MAPQTMRFRKKVEKDDNYVGTVLGLCQVVSITFSSSLTHV